MPERWVKPGILEREEYLYLGVITVAIYGRS